HIIPFSTQAGAGQTFTVTGGTSGLSAAKAFVNSFSANGFTNYEDPLQDAISWLQRGSPIAGADNYTYFVSDGEPNRYMTNSGNVDDGNAGTVMGQITGSDGTNEVAILQSLNEQVIAVGLEVNDTTLERLDIID